MKIIIAGCGRVGATIATKLSLEGHEISVIDKNTEAFESLRKNFKGQTIKGMAFDGDALKKAGIERADAFLSVTSGDNSNVVSATIAKDVFRVPKIVARIYDPRRAEIYRKFGIQTVSTVTWAANEILTLLTYTSIVRDISLGDGEVQITKAAIPPRLIGRTLNDLSVPGEISVIAIIRGGKAFIPSSADAFKEYDVAEIAVLTTSMPKLKRMLTP
jgi:trk system potassium uptake protein TrkA